ncbi:MAG: ribose-phosphate pyrophosphokinase [Anaerolineae bacterium]|nr:MAG: ribose-phosphate pyrophosphokinase [Anaerolineae bacterium]
MAKSFDDLFVFAGESNRELARAVCKYIGVPLKKNKTRKFSNDNLWIQLGESVRGKDVYIIQSLSEPVSDHLMEMLMMLNVARVGDARRVTAVIPYYSYARSDKKDAPRVCITARLVADLVQASGADRVITMMLHSEQVHGFFSMPLDHLTSQSVFVEHFKKYNDGQTVMVSPDEGFAKETVRLARALKLPVSIGTKVRLGDADVRIDAILGSSQIKRRAIVIDDEIATGSSMIKVMQALRENGAEEFILACTHGVFTRKAMERLQEIPDVVEIVSTDTVKLGKKKKGIDKLTVLSIANVLGEAILRNHEGRSMGSLFTFWPGE